MSRLKRNRNRRPRPHLRLAWLREERGLPQAHVARVLGLSHRHYARIEHGRIEPTAEELAVLAELLGLTEAPHRLLDRVSAELTPEEISLDAAAEPAVQE